MHHYIYKCFSFYNGKTGSPVIPLEGKYCSGVAALCTPQGLPRTSETVWTFLYSRRNNQLIVFRVWHSIGVISLAYIKIFPKWTPSDIRLQAPRLKATFVLIQVLLLRSRGRVVASLPEGPLGFHKCTTFGSLLWHERTPYPLVEISLKTWPD